MITNIKHNIEVTDIIYRKKLKVKIRNYVIDYMTTSRAFHHIIFHPFLFLAL